MNEPTEFQGMTALVTGASSGIGAETACALGAQGAFVMVHYHHNREGAEEVLRRIRDKSGDGLLLQADLNQMEGTRDLIEQVRKTGRAVDILVNNAGSLIKRTRFLKFTEDLWSQVMNLNLTSAVFLAQALLPQMVERKRGFVVNVSSVAARFGGGLGALAYSTAKGAMSTFTKGLAREFAPYGIRINAVSPGTIDTNYHRNFSKPEALAASAAATPMGRIGRPAEIADVVVFLCSEGARFMQGQVVEVNGGFLMV